MKVLLVAINSKYIHSNLAVYTLRAYAREYRQQIEIGEYTINHPVEYILKEIYKKKPDLLLFSCYIWNLEYIRMLIPECAKVLPGVPIWVGGPEVSYDARAFLADCLGAAGVMVGEGEETFRQLLDFYTGQLRELDRIPGLAYREADGVVKVVENSDFLELDQIPFPYQELTDFEHRIIYYESSRGCPFRCSYCLSSIDKRVRFRSLELVRPELQFFMDHRVPQVKFVDRTFNCHHAHAMEIWKYIGEHDNGVTNFHFEISADLLTEVELDLIREFRPGLIQLEIGVQSTNRDTIREIDRTMDLERLRSVVMEVHACGNIHQHLDLIAGLPFEDYDTFEKSFCQVYEMKPDQLQLGFLKVLKGSKMHRKADEYGVVYTDQPPYEVLFTKWLSYRDVLKLKGIEDMVETYYNSGQFTYTMNRLVTEFENPFKCYEALALFYEDNGYFHLSHSRIRRYEILQEFIMEVALSPFFPDCLELKLQPEIKSRQQYYRELLLYDLYLRENVKSRPRWAGDLTAYKGAFRAFYQKEEADPRYLKAYRGYSYQQLGKMTHLEVFHFDVTGSCEPGEFFILFDYKSRCPLTFAAASFKVEI